MADIERAGTAWCAAVALCVALPVAGCASGPKSVDPTANAEAAAEATQVSGSLEDWKDAVCLSGTGGSGTRHTVDGSACVPQDGDGIVNFDHFESASSMGSVLSWTPAAHVAQTVVDGRPLAIWTPSGEVGDLDPLQEFGFDVVSYQSAGFTRGVGEVPASVPDTGDAVTLPVNQFGYVVVQTAGGDTQCIVEIAFVGCQTMGTRWPQHADGSGPYHGVRINADGTGSWVDGNLGAAAPTTLTTQTYRAQGWTIVSSPAGLRFTNDKTGHGALVSVEGVQTF
ncbi:MAG: hypothetical protein AB7G47_04475 [Mycolicibacterium sp.]|uniref:hypothetical protein n=1 Tax=Mycolicibacterium sp. TaxID=2320850 RepID=UPI003D0F6B7F